MKRRAWLAWNAFCELRCPHHGRYCKGRACCCRDKHWGGL